MQQLSLTFEPGLAQRSRSLRDHLMTRVYNRGLVDTAGVMDMAPSKLTEKLAGVDSGGKPRGLTVDELEKYIQETEDLSPIHYLVDKYLRDPSVAQQEAAAKILDFMQQFPALIQAAGLQKPARAGRR